MDSSRRHFLRSSVIGISSAFIAACATRLPPTPISPAVLAGKTPSPKSGPTPTRSPTNSPPTTSPSNNFSIEILLGRPTADAITATCLTSTDVSVFIEYGLSSEHFTRQIGPVALKAKVPQHIQISGLRPNSAYVYRLQANGKTLAEHTFFTQRAPKESFSFTIDADPHNRDPRFDARLYSATMANILASRPDFHINLGDTFMTEKLKPQTYADVESTFIDMRPYFGQIGADVPIFLVNGNHEGELGWLLRGKDQNLPLWACALRQKYYPNPVPNAFYTGSTSIDPALGSVRDGYYAWRWGDALFIVLDPFWYTTQKPQAGDLNNNWNWTLGKEQYLWLKTTLETHPSPYKFVFTHHLVGGNLEARGGVEFARLFEWGGNNADGSYGFSQHRAGWTKPIHQLLIENQVQAVFHGHDHVYVKQTLDGILYQLVPQPNNAENNQTRLATEYGYLNGEVRNGSGYLRISVGPDKATVEYAQTTLAEAQTANKNVMDTSILLAAGSKK